MTERSPATTSPSASTAEREGDPSTAEREGDSSAAERADRGDVVLTSCSPRHRRCAARRACVLAGIAIALVAACDRIVDLTPDAAFKGFPDASFPDGPPLGDDAAGDSLLPDAGPDLVPDATLFDAGATPDAS